MKQHHKQRGYPIDEPVTQQVLTTAQLQALYPAMSEFNKALNLNTISKKAVFLILRSATLDNIHKGMKYGVWTSTPKSNARIDQIFKESEEVYLVYSVVGTKAFQACAKLLGPFDPTATFLYWDEPLKWFGSFPIQCLFLNELKQKVLDEKQPAHLGSIVLTEQTDCTEITNAFGMFVLQCFKDTIEDEANNILLTQFQNMDRREDQIRQQRDLDQNFLTQQSHEQQLFENQPFEYKNYHKRQNQQRWQTKQADQMMYMRAYYQQQQQYPNQQYQGNQQQAYNGYRHDNRQYNNYQYYQQYAYDPSQQQYQQYNQNYQRQPQKYYKKYNNNQYQYQNQNNNFNYQQFYAKQNEDQTVNNQDTNKF